MAQSAWNLPHDSQLLSFKEDKLRTLIAEGANEKRLLRTAESVVVARIKRPRMLRRALVPCGGQDLKNKYAEFDAKIAAIRTAGSAAILEEFRRKV